MAVEVSHACLSFMPAVISNNTCVSLNEIADFGYAELPLGTRMHYQ